MNVYVVVSDQPDNQWPHSIWSTREAAEAECERVNARGGADRYGVDVYELDPDLLSLVKDASWQFNEALSMLQEASLEVMVRARETGHLPDWVEDFREGQAEMQNVLTRLAEIVSTFREDES